MHRAGDSTIHFPETAMEHTMELPTEITCRLFPILLRLLQINGCNGELMCDVERCSGVYLVLQIDLFSFSGLTYLHGRHLFYSNQCRQSPASYGGIDTGKKKDGNRCE